MATIRRATPEDGDLIVEMLAIAADWRPGARIRAPGEILAEPALAHYVDRWGTQNSVGFVAEEVGADTPGAEEILPVGATWWTFFSGQEPGYGFVDESVPEVSIGVRTPWQDRGIGTLLLESLIAEARRCSLPALSLSVEPDNPAAALYRRLGFTVVAQLAGSQTMRLPLSPQRFRR